MPWVEQFPSRNILHADSFSDVLTLREVPAQLLSDKVCQVVSAPRPKTPGPGFKPSLPC
jgi:hypothetical protein